MIAYKFLRRGAVSPFAGRPWPLPRDGRTGDWVAADGPPALCRSGVHACRIRDLPYWLHDELWEVDLDGDVAVREHQLVAPRGRLVRRVDSWEIATAWQLAEDCLRHAAALAAAELDRVGLAVEAAALAAASTAVEIEVAGLTGFDAALDRQEQTAARVTYAAVSAARHIGWGGSREDAVAYAAFVAYASTVVSHTLDPAGGYAAERARQADWVAGRLGLG